MYLILNCKKKNNKVTFEQWFLWKLGKSTFYISNNTKLKNIYIYFDYFYSNKIKHNPERRKLFTYVNIYTQKNIYFNEQCGFF